ncbi:MAG: helix-turn-helix domain-containing protein, partial [bacterium]|nr:helix-turn-helix domain-containing protein [bacterium]
ACAAELEAYAWPGNVRELRNVVERAVYRWDEHSKPISHLTFDPFASPWKPRPLMPVRAPGADAAPGALPSPMPTSFEEIADLKAAVDAHEAAIVRAALERFRYNQRATAKGLGLSYDQLRHCMRKHGLAAG